MKKLFMFLGLLLLGSVVGSALDVVLGIEYPGFAPSLAHKFYYMVWGIVIWGVVGHLPKKGEKPDVRSK